jgi:uncharacterized protein YceK
MTRKLVLRIAAIAVLLLAGCATVPTGDIKIDSQVAAHANFSAYRTYAWLASAQIVNDPAGNWEPPQFDADAEIKWLIDREMRIRGINEVTAFPDMFVAFVAGVDMTQLALKQDPATKMELLENAPKGALVVMLIDGTSGDAVWAATAVGNVDKNRSAEESKARLDYAVTAMFRRLPKGAAP